MRKLVIALSLSTALLSGACAYLLWQRSDPRACTPALATEGMPTETRMDALVGERQRFRSGIERETAAAASTRVPDLSASRAHDVSVGGNHAVARRAPGESMLEPLAPEHRRTITRGRYGVIFHEMSLPAPLVDALLPILTAQDERRRSSGDLFAAREPQEEEAREREIAAVLGAEPAARFTELRRTMPARMLMRTLGAQLEQFGAPVSEEQKRGLLAALQDVQLPDFPRPDPSAPPRAGMERFRAWRLERAKRVREAAGSVLTREQLQRLDEQEAMQTEMAAKMPIPDDDE